MTLYKALKALSTDFDGDFSINFPEGFPIESGDMGFSGATFAEIAMIAPEAFTLTVTRLIKCEDEHHWETVEIDTAYGADYIGNLKETLTGNDEPPTISEVLDLRGFNPMVDDAKAFTIRECDEIAEITGTTTYEVIEELTTMVV